MLSFAGSVPPLGDSDPFSFSLSSDVNDGFLEYGGGGGGRIRLLAACEAILIFGFAESGGFTLG